MVYFILVTLLLSALCLYLLIYILRIKRQMKSISRQLPFTRETSNNAQIHIDLMDKDMIDMAAELNRNLDYQKKLKFEAEQSKSSIRQSISDIAHDLRTPLTVVKGNLKMMEEQEHSDSMNRYLENCAHQTQTLSSMVDEFFELSVLESDTGMAELVRVDMTKLVMNFVVEHEAVIRVNQLTPDIRLGEESLFVLGDEGYLLRMMNNLLNNVVKHARERFCMELALVERPETESRICRLTVSNALPENHGIDENRLFERTYRAEASRSVSGAGLGLYIVKLLADKQNMIVWAEIRDGELLIHLDMRLAPGERIKKNQKILRI